MYLRNQSPGTFDKVVELEVLNTYVLQKIIRRSSLVEDIMIYLEAFLQFQGLKKITFFLQPSEDRRARVKQHLENFFDFNMNGFKYVRVPEVVVELARVEEVEDVET